LQALDDGVVLGVGAEFAESRDDINLKIAVLQEVGQLRQGRLDVAAGLGEADDGPAAGLLVLLVVLEQVGKYLEPVGGGFAEGLGGGAGDFLFRVVQGGLEDGHGFLGGVRADVAQGLGGEAADEQVAVLEGLGQVGDGGLGLGAELGEALGGVAAIVFAFGL